jgi:hypothetical protein
VRELVDLPGVKDLPIRVTISAAWLIFLTLKCAILKTQEITRQEVMLDY